jgi:hypothetical protein
MISRTVPFSISHDAGTLTNFDHISDEIQRQASAVAGALARSGPCHIAVYKSISLCFSIRNCPGFSRFCPSSHGTIANNAGLRFCTMMMVFLHHIHGPCSHVMVGLLSEAGSFPCTREINV